MVQFYVPMDFLEPVLHKHLRLHRLRDVFPRHHTAIKTAIENLFRAIVVVITGMLSCLFSLCSSTVFK